MLRLISSACLFFLLVEQTASQTIHIGGDYSILATYLLNKNVTFNGDDSIYKHTIGQSAGITGAFYFHHGGYYHERIYGIKSGIAFSSQNQIFKVFPGQGLPNANVFYSFKTQLKYLDIPLLFSFCPNHHQGFVFELGPQLSFLQDAKNIAREYSPEKADYSGSIPLSSKSQYNDMVVSGLLGLGLFYNVSEKVALAGVFRIIAGLTDAMKNPAGLSDYAPTRKFAWGLNVQAYYKFNSYFARKNMGSDYYIKKMKQH